MYMSESVIHRAGSNENGGNVSGGQALTNQDDPTTMLVSDNTDDIWLWKGSILHYPTREGFFPDPHCLCKSVYNHQLLWRCGFGTFFAPLETRSDLISVNTRSAWTLQHIHVLIQFQTNVACFVILLRLWGVLAGLPWKNPVGHCLPWRVFLTWSTAPWRLQCHLGTWNHFENGIFFVREQGNLSPGIEGA